MPACLPAARGGDLRSIREGIATAAEPVICTLYTEIKGWGRLGGRGGCERINQCHASVGNA
jgi:hypothetical protein